MNFRQLSEALVDWANGEDGYQAWLNQPATRQRLSHRNERIGHYQLGVNRVPVSVQRGTLDQDFGHGRGHFMAFAKNSMFRTVLVYDPSGVTGPYAPAPEDVPEFMRQLRTNFPGYEIERYIATRTPAQCTDWDTWCQTWSLAWMHPDLQSLVYQAEALDIDQEIQRQRITRDIIEYFVTTPGHECPQGIVDRWHEFVKDNFWMYYTNRARTVVRRLRF